jgi:hypothetical protein
MRSNPMVLLIRGADEGRDLMGSWLEAEGYDVMVCPGPGAPVYTCVGERTGRCPLAEAADVVVLDGRLESGEVPDGTSPYDLLALYRSLDRPVLVLEGDIEVADLLADEGVRFLDDEGPGGLIRSVEGLVG